MSMKIEVGKYYRLRDGSKAYCLRNDFKTEYHPIVMTYNLTPDKESLLLLSGEGRMYTSLTSCLDIVSEWRELITLTKWINYYSESDWCVHDTKQEADKRANHKTRIACIKVTGTEGIE